MFIHYRTECLILKKEERGESDLLFTIYTKDFGKLEVLGKAVRKIASKLRPSAEVFYLSEIEFIQGKSQKTLTDAILIDKFPEIKKELKKTRIVNKIAEVLDGLIKGQEPDEKIWNLLTETFRKLNTESRFCGTKVKMRTKSSSQLEIIYYYFFWNLIVILGYQPELYHCIHCRKKITAGKNYFLPKEGGVSCGDCKTSESKEISPETIKILRIIIKKDWPTLLKLKFKAQYLEGLCLISSDWR
jgi:DNA repair protein RecO (recombination protein O)